MRAICSFVVTAWCVGSVGVAGEENVHGPSSKPARQTADLMELVLPASEPPPADPCVPWGLYFGTVATSEPVDATGDDRLSIVLRNAAPSYAFQFGVRVEQVESSFVYRFQDGLGASEDAPVGLEVTDAEGTRRVPLAMNTASADELPVELRRGAAVAAFSEFDLFGYDLEPATGGPGFTVGYISDLVSNEYLIPATAAEPECETQEIVTLEFFRPARFLRGDIDGNTEVEISDAVLVIQVVLENIPRAFDCEDALDADDSGEAELTDGVVILQYIYEGGDPPPPPFSRCGRDGTDDDPIDCAESNPLCIETTEP